MAKTPMRTDTDHGLIEWADAISTSTLDEVAT